MKPRMRMSCLTVLAFVLCATQTNAHLHKGTCTGRNCQGRKHRMYSHPSPSCVAKNLEEELKAPRGHNKPFGFHQTTWKEIPTLTEFPLPEVFYRDYFRKSVPLLIKGGAKHWTAITKWSNKTYFREKFGEDWMQVQIKKVYDNFHQFYAPMKMKEFLDIMESKSKTAYMDSTVTPAMAEDLGWPAYLHCDAIIKMLKQVAIFFNNGGSSSDVHYDVTETMMAQITGSRTWLIMRPEYVDDLYTDHFPWHTGSSPVNSTHVNLIKYPNIAKIDVYNATVNPGDIVYVPESWFHQVKAHGEPNIGIAIFVNFLLCARNAHGQADRDYLKSCKAWLEKQPKEIKCDYNPKPNISLSEIVRDKGEMNPNALSAIHPDFISESASPISRTLKSGKEVHMLGYRINGNMSEALDKLQAALKVGFRLFETDVQEPDISQLALGEALRTSVYANRSNVIISILIHPKHLGYQATKDAIRRAVTNIGTSYIDLVILAAPSCNNDYFKCDRTKSQGTWRDSWRAMGELHKEGLIHDLGLAHFPLQDLQALVKESKTPISVVMDRFDPTVVQFKLRKFCRENYIAFVGHSLLGTEVVRERKLSLKENPILRSEAVHIASYKYRACPAAVVMRWAMIKGVIALFRTSNPWHLLYNWQAHSMDLVDDSDTIKRVDVMHQDLRLANGLRDDDPTKKVTRFDFEML